MPGPSDILVPSFLLWNKILWIRRHFKGFQIKNYKRVECHNPLCPWRYPFPARHHQFLVFLPWMCLYVFRRECVSVYTGVSLCVNMYMCECIYINMCINTYASMCICVPFGFSSIVAHPYFVSSLHFLSFHKTHWICD